MELINKLEKRSIKAAVFDFDGTLSTIRHGWEGVMKPFMLAEICPGTGEFPPELEREVDDYIAASTGIQTIHQMQWLADKVRDYGKNSSLHDIWWYKQEYNRRLMLQVEQRLEALRTGVKTPEDFLVAGAVDFLRMLAKQGVALYIASGTDQPDVQREAELLGVAGMFTRIAGAPEQQIACSKEAVIRSLMEEQGLGKRLAVLGDGPVEIALAKQYGALAVGIASDEGKRQGVDEIKRQRLINAHADVIMGDFLEGGQLWELATYPQKFVAMDVSGVRTWSARSRTNLVTVENMACLDAPPPTWDCPEIDTLADRIMAARRSGSTVIWSQGAHVIKNGMARYIIDLMAKGLVTAVAGNGACSIHDFELAYLGGTSENVATAIEDGSFGMWEETGSWMNAAIQHGAENDLGYGESLAVYIEEHMDQFPYRDDCLFYQAYQNGVPATYHIALGTDIIHQHPMADFGAIGKTSGTDFHYLCSEVARMDGGVFLNFGSGVIGPEVFLKALSIARNQGHPTFQITTANFDLRDLGDFRANIGYDDPDYYYRPRKNIVNRPTSRGGWGHHFCVDHQVSIPVLYHKLMERMVRDGIQHF